MDKMRISEADVKDLIATLDLQLYKAYRDNAEMEKRYEAEIGRLNVQIGELEMQIHRDAVKYGTKINKLADRAAHLEKENWALAGLTRSVLTPKEVNFDYMNQTTTFTWIDGTKTSVRLEKGGLWSVYDAFTAALAKRVFGTNSAVKSVLKRLPMREKVGYADNDH